jgi:type II secretory ATPase GspE/PulE/Tfp pilus assembly ATPase PilB-like protein
MQVKAFLINAAVTGILAQRLVRVLCDACKYQAPLTPEEQAYVERLGMHCTAAFRADGCVACNKTGYRGRTGIFELLLFTPQLRAKIHDSSTYDELLQAAREQGMQSLAQDGIKKVAAGVTSVRELMRVVV